MKVLLVNPPRFNKLPVVREERCEIIERNSILPPYSLLQIASLLRERGHEVSLIDANGENINYSAYEKIISQMDYEAVIFRFTPTTFDWDMRIAAISKKSMPPLNPIRASHHGSCSSAAMHAPEKVPWLRIAG